jgi:hypothetical protein
VKYHPEIEYSRGTIFLNSQTEGDILVVFLWIYLGVNLNGSNEGNL